MNGDNYFCFLPYQILSLANDEYYGLITLLRVGERYITVTLILIWTWK